MASLSDIVNVSISTQTAAIKRDSFGLPLIVGYHSRFAERVRTYGELSEMVSDGFATTDAEFAAAAAAFAQSPRLSEIAIGRRALNPTIRVDLYPTAVNSKAYSIDITKPDGTVQTVTYTADSSTSVAEITAGLTAAIEAVTGMAATDQTTYVRVTADTATSYFAIKVADKALLRAQQSHADPGIGTDLDAILLENNSWYGLTLTTQGAAEIAAAATWAESNKKLLIQGSQDGDIIVAGSGDIASTVKAATQYRTAIVFSSDPTEHAGAALMGAGFSIDPGGMTVANLSLASVTSEPLTSSHIAQLQAKNCNYFTSYGNTGLSLVRNGKTGAGEWIDVIRDRDWFENLLQTDVLNVMVNNDKVPFTDRGIGQLEAAVRGSCETAVSAGFLADGSVTVEAPLASEVSSVDRANRTLGSTPIKVFARVAGAIHIAEIRATITA